MNKTKNTGSEADHAVMESKGKDLALDSMDRPWLEYQVYAPKRLRTSELVKKSVDALKKEGRPVSLDSIRQRSKELDPEGRGISHSSILNNANAKSYYEQHRDWKRIESVRVNKIDTRLLRIRTDRNIAQVKRRYMNMSKRELVEKLLIVEQCYAEQGATLMAANDEILSLQMQLEELG